MRNKIGGALLAACLVSLSPAIAQPPGPGWDRGPGGPDRGPPPPPGGPGGPGRDYYWHGDRGDWNPRDDYRPGRYRERRMGRDDQIFHGRDGRYYCRRNDGTTGLVIGALGGGVAGSLLGGGTLGTLLGAGGGALLGRSIDRGHVRCR